MSSDDFISIEVKGLDKLMAAFQKFPREVARQMSQAAHEAGKEIIETEGLKNYPGMTSANRPPTPYYIRGSGMKYKSYLKKTSETLKNRWYIRREGYNAKIGNSASYAKYVHGDEQAHHMGPLAAIPKGWKKLSDVAKDKMPEIKRIYQLHINKVIARLGL